MLRAFRRRAVVFPRKLYSVVGIARSPFGSTLGARARCANTGFLRLTGAKSITDSLCLFASVGNGDSCPLYGSDTQFSIVSSLDTRNRLFYPDPN
jgi:hypothetical protein